MDEQGENRLQELLTSFNNNPFHNYLGLKVIDAKKDYACLRLTKTADTPQGIGGSVNGGVIATMIDLAAIPAVFGGLREGSQPAGTADLQVTYLRQSHGEWIDARATVLKRGRQLCTVEVDIINDQEVLCAKGRVLYALRTTS
ncbi:MAG: PaaI family thioesterase [Pseudomonadota bacterium]